MKARAASFSLEALAIGLLLLQSAASGQEVSTPIGLYARQFEASVLFSNAVERLFRFRIDHVRSLDFRINYPRTGLITSITGPSGELIDPATVGMHGGHYASTAANPGGNSLVIGAPGLSHAHTYIYTLPFPQAGDYQLRVRDPHLQPEEILVLTVEVSLQSDLAATIITTQPVALNSKHQIFSVAVADGAQAVRGANVLMNVVSPGGAILQMPLFDDGQRDLHGDFAADDGLYSNTLTPEQIAQPGRYLLAARVSKLNLNDPGIPEQPNELFVREVATEIEVVAPAARLEALAVSSGGVNLDDDPCFEELAVTVPIIVTAPGRYQLEAVLEGTNANSVIGMGRQEFQSGAGNISATVDADTIRQKGDTGPYRIRELRLYYLDGPGIQPADYAYELASMTAPLSLEQFGCPPLQITRLLGDVARDLDSDTDFDRLDVTVGVLAPAFGAYQVSAALMSSCGAHVYISGQHFVTNVASEQSFVLQFPGAELGRAAIDGPWTLGEVTINGSTESLVQSVIGQTAAYRAAQFDGYVAPVDCPSLTCPTNLIHEASETGGIVLIFPNCLLTTCETLVPVSCNPPSGSFFPLGQTAVVCGAVVPPGATNQCQFTVTIRDTSAPEFDCPSNIVIYAEAPEGATFNHAPAVSDVCDANVALVCHPSPGSILPVGTTSVVCLATDVSGNSSQCGFTITVRGWPRIPGFRRVGTTLELSFATDTDAIYVIEFKNALDDPQWTPLQSLLGMGDVVTVAVDIENIPSRFFRVRIHIP